MADDPLLSQSEIDELLRSLRGDTHEAALASSATRATILVGEAPRAPVHLPPSLALLRNVRVEVSVDLGETQMELGELLQIGRSTLLVFDGQVDSTVLLRVNGVPFARGIVVESHGRYAVRLVEPVAAAEPI